MRDAMVAAEDVRFYEHKSDMQGVIRAFIANQQPARSPGCLHADPAVREEHPQVQR